MRLTPLLTEHAVLQRNQSIPVWGWTDAPRTRLRATLAGHAVEGISGDDSRFLLRLPPLAAGGPHTLTVEALAGPEKVSVEDILIGEVWLASGQSNMQWSMSNSNYDEAIRAAVPAQIRMFNVERRAAQAPQSTVKGQWDLSTPQTLPDFSAVATWFGNRIQDTIGVPVGIIHSSWGGSFIETWISREQLLRNPTRAGWVVQYERDSFSLEKWSGEDSLESRLPADPGNEGAQKGWHQPDFNDSAWDTLTLPQTWQQAGHNHSGVFWFRRRIALPPELVGQPLTLSLGAVDKQDITYVNGTEVGRTGTALEQEHWNKNREYPVPAELTRAGELVIAVRAYSFIFAGGLIGPADRMELLGGADAAPLPLSGDWHYALEHNLGLVETGGMQMGHGCHNSPYMLYENMIRPLLPVGIAGAIWYQGESNSDSPERYRQLMLDLITDWRFHFGVGDFPFIQVQLANFMAPLDHQPASNWARLREAQAAACKLDNAGMAVIIDAGEADDIHPKDKKTVGHRLAQWALARVYGREAVPGGPLYRGHAVEGDRVRILFADVGTGLALREGAQVETLFLAGPDGEFRPAHSALEGASLVVWHEAVKTPQAVRYAWADNPLKANLVNSLGYPAGPFRTDCD